MARRHAPKIKTYSSVCCAALDITHLGEKVGDGGSL